MTDNKTMKIMKKYIVALVFAALCLPFVSCNKEEQKQHGDVAAYLPISDMTIHPLGDTVHVSFTSASSWTIEDKPDFIQFVSPTKGYAGTTNLTIVIDAFVDKNNTTSTKTRREDIVFKTAEGTKAFTITQDRAYIKVMAVDQDNNVGTADISDEITFDWHAEERKYIVESNVRWKANVTNAKDGYRVNIDNAVWNSSTLYGEDNTNELSVEIDDNFDNKFSSNISFIPCKTDWEGNLDTENKTFDDLTKKISVTQDYLYLKVYSSKPNADVSHQETFDNFSELGETREFYVLYQESLENKYEIHKNSNLSDRDADMSSFEFEKVQGGTDKGELTIDSRVIKWQKYSAKFIKANPSFTNPRTIACIVKPLGDNLSQSALRPIYFEQNAYTFNLQMNSSVLQTINPINNEGGTYTINLNTLGRWKILYPETHKSWATITFPEDSSETINSGMVVASGTGNASIIINVADRNLSFTQDNTLPLTFKATNIENDYGASAAQTSTTFTQPKFVFDVEVTYDNETVTEVSSHTKKEYAVNVKSSGNWEIETPSEEWVTLNGESIGAGNNSTRTLSFEPNGDSVRYYTLKVTSKEHAESGIEEYENNATREVKITQHEMRANILDVAGGTTYTGTNFSAYKDNSNDRTASFYLECSAPWTLTQKPSWLTLRKGNETISSGYGLDDGEYYPMSMEVDNNLDSKELSGRVNFEVAINDHETRNIGFNVTQDGFVFETSNLKSEYSYEAINNTSESSFIAENTFQITLTKDATLQTNASTNGWLKINISENTAAATEKTKSYNCTIVPSQNIDELNAEPREKVIGIGIKNGSQFKQFESVKFTQQSFEWELQSNTLNPFAVTANNAQYIIVSKCTKEGSTRCYDVKLRDGAEDWLNVTYSGLQVTASTKSINASTTQKRSGKIVFVVKHSALTDGEELVLQTINVEQNKYIWDVNYNGKTAFEPVYSSASDYNGKITIKSSGVWVASTTNSSIASISLSAGSGNETLGETIDVAVQPNYTLKPREVTITISNSDISKTETIKLTQNAYEFNVENTAVTLSAAKGSKQELTVTCSNGKNWSVEVADDGKEWLKAENKSGKLAIETLTANDTKADRSTKVTVHSNDGANLSIEITVTQVAEVVEEK